MSDAYINGRPEALKLQMPAFLQPVSKSMSGQFQGFFDPIVFQFIPEIKDSGETAEYESIGDGLGRAEQYKMYKNGKSRTYTISTVFAATGDSYDTAWVQQQIMRLRGLTKPLYDREDLFNGKSKNYYAPPLILFTYGTLWVNIPVVITTVNPTPDEGSQIDFNGLPVVMNVEIQMETNYPYGYVPGYLNYWKAWNAPGTQPGTFDQGQLSYGGNTSPTAPSATAEEIRLQNAAIAEEKAAARKAKPKVTGAGLLDRRFTAANANEGYLEQVGRGLVDFKIEERAKRKADQEDAAAAYRNPLADALAPQPKQGDTPLSFSSAYTRATS